MAQMTGILGPGTLATVYSRTAIQPGTRAFDESGNEYIFLKGCASTVVGSVVVFDANNEFDTALVTTGALGPVAIAMAITVAGKCGWYCIWGACEAKYGLLGADDTLTDNISAVGRSVADGMIGKGPTAGDIIYGIVTRSAKEYSADPTATTLVQIYYPFLDAQTAGH